MRDKALPFLAFHWKLLRLTYAAWQRDKAARLGASLAFYSVLSLGPLLLLVLVIAANIWGQRAAQGQIVDQMAGIMGEPGAQVVQGILKTSSQNKHGGLLATIFSFATLLFSASGVFGELQDAMNTIWKVPPRNGKPWFTILRDRFLSFTMVVGCSFLLLISLVISTAMEAAVRYTNHLIPSLSVIMPTFDFLTSFLIITLLFGMTFKMVPDTKVQWHCVWPGAMITAVLFIIGKMLIGLYLAHTSVASSYGAAGSVIIILMWVYYSAQILFFGAEYSHMYGKHCEPRK